MSRDVIRIPRRTQALGAPLQVPMPAVVLAIDAASRAGLATYIAGGLHWYGEVRTADGPARRRAIRDAMTTAEVRCLPLGAVIEVPFGGRVSAALSLTATVALWRDTWCSLGNATERMLEFTANEWRRALFSQSGMPREQVRKLEALTAARIATRDLPMQHHYTIGADAAAAICIGQVAIRSGALASALGLTTKRSYTP